MLRQQNGQLADFLTNDPGQAHSRIHQHFCLSNGLAKEQNEADPKMKKQPMHNIEHIKEIVAMQQSYAKVSGLFRKSGGMRIWWRTPLRLEHLAAFLNGIKIERVREFDA